MFETDPVFSCIVSPLLFSLSEQVFLVPSFQKGYNDRAGIYIFGRNTMYVFNFPVLYHFSIGPEVIYDKILYPV